MIAKFPRNKLHDLYSWIMFKVRRGVVSRVAPGRAAIALLTGRLQVKFFAFLACLIVCGHTSWPRVGGTSAIDFLSLEVD